ncbi:hypothetical protein Syun_024815 [Stephania yunnanensis]|uniref:Uncharacterized protein n=1 Tax=Stephania yunnanensis TaxID=152371 RepID=A0AAP0HVN4_9MAGN
MNEYNLDSGLLGGSLTRNGESQARGRWGGGGVPLFCRRGFLVPQRTTLLHDDDEQQQQQQQQQSVETPKISDPFSSLPKPKSSSAASSIFTNLKNPKSNHEVSSISAPNPRRVVQFKPPMNPILSKSFLYDDDDEEERIKRKPTKESAQLSGKSLFSILPAPKNSGGLGSGAALGSGGRSMVVVEAEKGEAGGSQLGESESDEGREGLGSYGGYYGNYEGSYGYGHYEGSSSADAVADAVAVAAPAMGEPDWGGVEGGVGESLPRMPGKRGRDEMPMEFVEVRQDELMKNRPREDQAKSTGIAFGPAYQPVSSKGKPSKLHKRKHQIGSLYFDMKQRETELTERRSKGLLTKAETQAKYVVNAAHPTVQQATTMTFICQNEMKERKADFISGGEERGTSAYSAMISFQFVNQSEKLLSPAMYLQQAILLPKSRKEMRVFKDTIVSDVPDRPHSMEMDIELGCSSIFAC